LTPCLTPPRPTLQLRCAPSRSSTENYRPEPRRFRVGSVRIYDLRRSEASQVLLVHRLFRQLPGFPPTPRRRATGPDRPADGRTGRVAPDGSRGLRPVRCDRRGGAIISHPLAPGDNRDDPSDPLTLSPGTVGLTRAAASPNGRAAPEVLRAAILFADVDEPEEAAPAKPTAPSRS
jgi:hypothetical protein